MGEESEATKGRENDTNNRKAAVKRGGTALRRTEVRASPQRGEEREHKLEGQQREQ